MAQHKDPPVAYLSVRGVELIGRTAARAFWAVPVLLIMIKIADRFLRSDPKPWWRQVASGFFGKIDDYSFWITVTGLICCTQIAAAIAHLASSRSRTESGWPIRAAQVKLWLVLSLIATLAYLAGIYMTDGTLFIKAAPKDRIAQVPEGLLNIGLFFFIYWYAVLGLQAIDSVRVRAKASTSPPMGKDTLLAAEYLINVTFSLILSTIGCVALIVGIKALGALVFKYTEWPVFDWSLFKPDPLGGIADKLIAMAFIFILMFLPFTVFALRLRRALPPWVAWRLNLRLRVKPLAISTEGGVDAGIEFARSVPRLVVVTLIELVDTSAPSQDSKVAAIPGIKSVAEG